MENPCKKHVDKKVYSFRPVSEGKPIETLDIMQISCPKEGAKDGSQQLKAMAPPPYSDLGKRAKDVFSKGYHFGLIKLDCKTKTPSGVQFNTGGVSDQESGKVTGSLESKYTCKDYGVTFTEKWNTSNSLGTEISAADLGLKGLKVTGGINFSPQDGYQSGVAKIAYGNDRVAINIDGDLKPDGQIVKGAAVVTHQGWLAGYQGAFDVQNTKLAKSNFALGFVSKDFVLHTQVEKDADEEGQIYSGNILFNITQKLATGIDIAWEQSGEKTTFGFGLKYECGVDAIIGAKIDKEIQIGMSLSQLLREGIRLTLSSNIDGNNINGGGNHKIGLALELEGDDGQVFGGAIYQQINPNLETAINLSWATSGEKTAFGLGCKYNLDQDAALRAKINNSSQIGLGYQQRLREGVILTLSTIVDGKNFNQGGHKIGLALELEA